MAGRAQQAQNRKAQGAWAYSDAFDHIVVKIGERWHGFPRGYLVRKKQIHGFQTGDWIRADVHAGQKAGVHVGRYAVRATGSFDIQAGSGLKQGVSHRYCRLIQRGRLRIPSHPKDSDPQEGGSESRGVVTTPRYPSPA